MSSSLNYNNPTTWYNSVDDNEKNLFKEWVKELLKTEEVNLTFKKKDNTIRKMYCTLKESKLPKIDATKESSARKKSDDAISVFDLDKNEWRSFRYDSIQEIKFTLGE